MHTHSRTQHLSFIRRFGVDRCTMSSVDCLKPAETHANFKPVAPPVLLANRPETCTIIVLLLLSIFPVCVYYIYVYNSLNICMNHQGCRSRTSGNVCVYRKAFAPKQAIKWNIKIECSQAYWITNLNFEFVLAMLFTNIDCIYATGTLHEWSMVQCMCVCMCTKRICQKWNEQCFVFICLVFRTTSGLWRKSITISFNWGQYSIMVMAM